MKLQPCLKHEKQNQLQIQEEHRKSGDIIFKVKCTICGKLGPWRKTIHGAQMAWNESIARQRCDPGKEKE